MRYEVMSHQDPATHEYILKVGIQFTEYEMHKLFSVREQVEQVADEKTPVWKKLELLSSIIRSSLYITEKGNSVVAPITRPVPERRVIMRVGDDNGQTDTGEEGQGGEQDKGELDK